MVGESLNEIARRLTERGTPSKMGGRWSSVALGSLLSNPILYGHFYDNRWRYIKTPREDGGKPKIRREPLPKSQWKKVMDVPAIIDKRTYDKIQTLIHDRRKTRNVAKNDPFLLRDLLYCSECSGKMVPSRGVRKQDNYYACYWERTSDKKLVMAGRDRCGMGYIPAAEVEEILFAYAKRVFQQPEILIEHLAEPKKLKTELASTEKNLADQKKQLSRIEKEEIDLARKLAAGKVPAHISQKLFSEREETRSRLTDQIAELERKVIDLRSSCENFSTLREFASDVGRFQKVADGVLDKLTNTQKKQLIRAAVAGAKLVVQEVPSHLVQDVGLLRKHARGIKGEGEVAEALRTIGDTARPFPKRSTRTPKYRHRPGDKGWWRVILQGALDVAQVIDLLAAFGEEIRGKLGINKSIKTSQPSCRH